MFIIIVQSQWCVGTAQGSYIYIPLPTFHVNDKTVIEVFAEYGNYLIIDKYSTSKFARYLQAQVLQMSARSTASALQQSRIHSPSF
jgi:hypothetical protein